MLVGYEMKKKNIRNFGKIFNYLKDPDLRKRETGDSILVVEGAEFSGEHFEGMTWQNVSFKNCDFIGGYEIGPKRSINVRYEDCRFAGVLSYGVADNLWFLRCSWAGASVMFAEKGSKNVLFETCSFVGTSADPNRQGSVGSGGESRYLRCKAIWFNWTGDASLSIKECECEGVSIHTDSFGNSGEDYLSALVSIEQSKLRGKFDMVASDLQSLTIRDTTLEHLDLSDATIKGDVVMERVKGGFINAYVKQARSLSVRNSQIQGNGKKIFEAYAGGIQSITIDAVVFGGDLSSEPVTIAGGFSLKSADRISNVSQSVDIRNSTIPTLDASYLNTQRLVLRNNQITRANISNSRMADLEVSGTSVTGKLDFRGTQAVHQKVELTAGSALGRVDQMDGSNIKLEPRSRR